jgi:hypothetical protein
MQPSEFWNLSPTEFWWEFDMKIRVQKKLEDMKERPKPGKFTEAEWEAARKRFREIENGAARNS